MSDHHRPAFPNSSDTLKYPGLTRREYFAALVMQSMLAHSTLFMKSTAREAVWIANLMCDELDNTSEIEETL